VKARDLPVVPWITLWEEIGLLFYGMGQKCQSALLSDCVDELLGVRSLVTDVGLHAQAEQVAAGRIPLGVMYFLTYKGKDAAAVSFLLLSYQHIVIGDKDEVQPTFDSPVDEVVKGAEAIAMGCVHVDITEILKEFWGSVCLDHGEPFFWL